MEIHEIIEEAKLRLEKIGVYMDMATLSIKAAPPDSPDGAVDEDSDDDEVTPESILHDPALKQKMADGTIKMAFYTVSTVNDLAFSERIQNPKAHREEREFLKVVPPEEDMFRENLRAKLLKAAESGDLLSALDDDDDFEDD